MWFELPVNFKLPAERDAEVSMTEDDVPPKVLAAIYDKLYNKIKEGEVEDMSNANVEGKRQFIEKRKAELKAEMEEKEKEFDKNKDSWRKELRANMDRNSGTTSSTFHELKADVEKDIARIEKYPQTRSNEHGFRSVISKEEGDVLISKIGKMATSHDKLN